METKKSKKVVSIFLLLFILIPTIIAVFPLLALTLASFKPSTELMRYGLNLKLQLDILSLDNYIYLFTDGSIYFHWFKNSIIISFASTVLALGFSSMVGYSLAMYRFKGQAVVMFLVILIMMIPFEILMLPLFRLMILLNAVDTYA